MGNLKGFLPGTVLVANFQSPSLSTGREKQRVRSVPRNLLSLSTEREKQRVRSVPRNLLSLSTERVKKGHNQNFPDSNEFT
jgi:hypothetical protein